MIWRCWQAFRSAAALFHTIDHRRRVALDWLPCTVTKSFRTANRRFLFPWHPSPSLPGWISPESIRRFTMPINHRRCERMADVLISQWGDPFLLINALSAPGSWLLFNYFYFFWSRFEFDKRHRNLAATRQRCWGNYERIHHMAQFQPPNPRPFSTLGTTHLLFLHPSLLPLLALLIGKFGTINCPDIYRIFVVLYSALAGNARCMAK